ncbi:hypothetical protein ACQKP5_06565 [Pseudomonas vancouverensis]|uniref:hypothetical protein n=1 Tax=Pseudomonas vancouverensis TaxID=95300 RepID=UPI003D00E0F0
MKIISFTEKGRITRVIDYPENACPYDDLLQMYPDALFMAMGARVNDINDYVNNGEVVPRPRMSDIKLMGRVLYGVPAGASLSVEGQEYLADGSDIELAFDLPGAYRITVALWPYLDEEVVYEAQP